MDVIMISYISSFYGEAGIRLLLTMWMETCMKNKPYIEQEVV